MTDKATPAKVRLTDRLGGCHTESRDDGMPASADERKLRRMYAVRVGMPNLYMDDGEASGHEHGIFIDFMREPVADIAVKVLALEVARYKCLTTPNAKLTGPREHKGHTDEHH